MSAIFYKNTLYAGGGSGGHEVYYGTSVPSASQGTSGDIYIRLDSNGNMIEEYIKLGNDWTLIPESNIVLGTKTITSNGTYSAQADNFDGFSSVTVDVSGAGSTPYINLMNFPQSPSGNYSYTIPKDGTYMLIVGYTYRSSNVDIVLPSGSTVIINRAVENSERGFKVVIAELLKNDVISLNGSPSTWVGIFKGIFELVNMNISRVVEANVVSDTSFTKDSTSAVIGNVLCIALASARTWANTWNHSTYNDGALIKGEFSTQTHVQINYCDTSNFPTLNMYGYDGGYAGYLILA